jgi:peptide deformylase
MSPSAFTILQLGHPNLRLVSKPVDDIASETTQLFIQQLLSFVEQAKGMGIAAPQVNHAIRLFIMSSHPNERYPYAPIMDKTVVMNPEIIWLSDETVKDWEGCLSVPGVRALVPRHQVICVKYILETGELYEAEYTGFLARLFQHEFDHLNGLVFLDRVEDSHDIVMEQEWLKMIATRR